MAVPSTYSSFFGAVRVMETTDFAFTLTVNVPTSSPFKKTFIVWSPVFVLSNSESVTFASVKSIVSVVSSL